MSAHLNTDTLVSALENPTIVIGGNIYTARVLSFRDAVKLQHKLQSLDLSDPDVLFAFVDEVCEKTGLPCEQLLDLPAPVFSEVLESFLSLLITGKTVTTT